MLAALQTLVAAFARCERGNVLPMLAAALIPILVTIGGGVDYARASLAQAKLQEAVDSAALAGRRSMSQDNIETAKPKINAFMRFNYPDATYGTKPLKLTITKPQVGVVRVQATTSIDTTLLALIGIDEWHIGAVGEATQNLDNVDIVLVLDTTGSMNDLNGGQRKIDALRKAVQSLYDELAPAQAQLRSQNLRMRIGVVPYSSTVNIGKLLRAKNSSSIREQNAKYYHWRNASGTWSFAQRTYDLRNYVAGNTFGSPNGHSNYSSSRWKGCVEERATINTITANDSRNAAPPEAWDLDIDMLPGSDEKTRWQPYVYDPFNGETNTYCPSQVTLLADLNRSDIDRIVGELTPSGSTYHDIGMIWGTRIISGGGVFGADNPSTYNGRPVTRHIIYMTDGLMSAPVESGVTVNICTQTFFGFCIASVSIANDSLVYSGYGVEVRDRRVGGTSQSDNEGRHTKRFLMACNAAKAKNVTVWTIAFATGKVDSLTKCASNPDQAYTVDNSSDLITKFSEIGRNLGALRISK